MKRGRMPFFSATTTHSPEFFGCSSFFRGFQPLKKTCLRSPLFILAAVLLLSTFEDSAHARIYKWVDESGKVHFPDRPPSDPNIKPESMKGTVFPKPPAGSKNERGQTKGSERDEDGGPGLPPPAYLLGPWKGDVEKMKDLPEIKKDPAGAAFILGFLKSFKIEFAQDTFTVHGMNETKTIGYKVTQIRGDTLTLISGQGNITIKVLDEGHLYFHQDKEQPYYLTRP
ncbi:MAG: hypothetical protein COV67_02045 [Nitrospinae bacterium CG11_big_fil_rev_8_21_14_0_20_56_8]|nr:MAG: hypothetical protein COV67_02045 [Nitrospinae bacterium CG11_big_fil_rev_8_21_14_0_20_56_8]